MPSKNDHSDLFGQLERGIAALTSSSAWYTHLAFQSRFHRYSYGNVLLIAAQNPRASQVAGFAAWRRLDRGVRKGEKAIWILAPMMGRKKQTDQDTEPVVRGFRYVPVFDISQTEGPTPPAVCHKLSGGDPSGLYDRFLAVAESFGFHVEDHTFTDGTNGDCSPSGRRIRVERSNSGAQRVKTLAHELAHALLHDHTVDRALAELEAESTAYVVCRSVGLDSGTYSFGYVATWAGGGEPAILAIKASCERIQKAAAIILQSLPDHAQQAA
jgi:antirestriction protein ArdC